MTSAVLVTGGTGQLGQALARAAWPAGWQPHVVTRADLDLADPAAIAAMHGREPAMGGGDQRRRLYWR